MSDPLDDDVGGLEPAEIAAVAGLNYAVDSAPGIRRQRRGRGFSYAGPDGSLLHDADERARIAALAIPPAWTDVWISTDPDAHLLATGRDARGRKQYRYHPRWRTVRDTDKYERLSTFASALPSLRKEVDGDLGRRGLDRRKVLALVVRLLDDTLIRVGNARYAEENDSYGLTTLRPDHLSVDGARLEFDFVGKSGVHQRIEVADPKLAKVVRRCHELPGHHLFAYLGEDGDVEAVTSSEVNAYLREAVGPDVSAKDFRTWGGTRAAAAALAVTPLPPTAKAVEQAILGAYDVAATVLGNTRAVCRACYVHPTVPDAFRAGALHESWRVARAAGGLDRPERMVARLLDPG